MAIMARHKRPFKGYRRGVPGTASEVEKKEAAQRARNYYRGYGNAHERLAVELADGGHPLPEIAAKIDEVPYKTLAIIARGFYK